MGLEAIWAGGLDLSATHWAPLRQVSQSLLFDGLRNQL